MLPISSSVSESILQQTFQDFELILLDDLFDRRQP